MISELLLYNNHKKIILNNHYSYPFRIVSVWCIIILFDWKLLTNVSLCTLANLSLIFVGNDVKYGFRFYKNTQTHKVLRMHVSITFPCGWYTINMLIIKSHFVYIYLPMRNKIHSVAHTISWLVQGLVLKIVIVMFLESMIKNYSSPKRIGIVSAMLWPWCYASDALWQWGQLHYSYDGTIIKANWRLK